MSLVVQKFGGTSVADSHKIMAAARKAIRAQQQGHQVVMVVSAMGKQTDLLVELAQQIHARPPAREMVMVMNGFSTEFNGQNTFYAVNTVAFHHVKHPIPVRVGELQRIYLTNLTEFDLINSFHLHADMFRVYRTGTTMDHYELTDTVMLCQGERHILEFTLPAPGMYMFHAHQSEFAELGWMGFFKAVEA